MINVTPISIAAAAQSYAAELTEKLCQPYCVNASIQPVVDVTYTIDDTSLVGTTLYVTLFPCNECAKAIIQSGIREIIYLSDKYAATPGTLASKRMLKSAGITLRRLESDKAVLTLPLSE